MYTECVLFAAPVQIQRQPQRQPYQQRGRDDKPPLLDAALAGVNERPHPENEGGDQQVRVGAAGRAVDKNTLEEVDSDSKFAVSDPP